jgi:hypothetical protein
MSLNIHARYILVGGSAACLVPLSLKAGRLVFSAAPAPPGIQRMWGTKLSSRKGPVYGVSVGSSGDMGWWILGCLGGYKLRRISKGWRAVTRPHPVYVTIYSHILFSSAFSSHDLQTRGSHARFSIPEEGARHGGVEIAAKH